MHMKINLHLIGFMAAILAAQSQPVHAADKSFIYDYDGNVILVRRGIGQPMKSDMQIKENDILRSDTNGSTDIIMNQLCGIRFQTATECVFEDIKSGSAHLTMSSGWALVNLKPMPSGGEFTLETPNVVITANLLTQFLCRIDGEEKEAATLVAVKKGRVTVRVKSSGASISVLGNQAVDVRPETFITPPRETTQEEAKMLFKVNSVIMVTE